tara:strand:- start:364 stop:555 length:192 start_codon:yes stop_codon:yes gene_type:complete
MSRDYRKPKKRSWAEDYEEDGTRGVRREQRKGKRKQDKKMLRDLMNDSNKFDDYAEDLEQGDW